MEDVTCNKYFKKPQNQTEQKTRTKQATDTEVRLLVSSDCRESEHKNIFCKRKNSAAAAEQDSANNSYTNGEEFETLWNQIKERKRPRVGRVPQRMTRPCPFSRAHGGC